LFDLSVSVKKVCLSKKCICQKSVSVKKNCVCQKNVCHLSGGKVSYISRAYICPHFLHFQQSFHKHFYFNKKYCCTELFWSQTRNKHYSDNLRHDLSHFYALTCSANFLCCAVQWNSIFLTQLFDNFDNIWFNFFVP